MALSPCASIRPSFIEDIFESGAMIRIGGKGVPNIQLKLQFTLEGKLIIMFGVVRTVEYNSDIDQSRLHFECVHIEPQMKNQILSFVYNIMSPEERRAYELFPIGEDAEDEAPQADDTGEEPAEEAGDAAFAYELSDTKIPDTTDALIDTMVGNG